MIQRNCMPTLSQKPFEAPLFDNINLNLMVPKSKNLNNNEISISTNDLIDNFFGTNLELNQIVNNIPNNKLLNDHRNYVSSNLEYMNWQFFKDSFDSFNQINRDFKLQTNNSSKKNPFTHEEDDLLTSLVNLHGIGNWQKISQDMQKKNFNRNGRQCRDRYYHYLDPGINMKSNWSEEEDMLILKFVKEEGKRWKGMEKLFPGRTEVSIRNRYNLLIRKMTKNERKAEKKKEKEKDEEFTLNKKYEKTKNKRNLLQLNSTNQKDQIDASKSIENPNFQQPNLNTNTKTLPKIFDDSIYDSLFSDAFNFNESIFSE